MLLSEDFFIPADRNIDKESADILTWATAEKETLFQRWDTPKGRDILTQWEAGGFNREVLDRLVGRFYEHTDLRGVNLDGKNLSNADLSNIDFYAASLRNAILKNADLRHTYMSEAHIEGAQFHWANMESVFLDNVKFNGQTSFMGVDLSRINFTLAALVQDLAITENRIEIN